MSRISGGGCYNVRGSKMLKSIQQRHRERQIAEYVANGMTVADAGKAVGLSKGQTARCWSNIRRDLGSQAV